MKPSPQERIDTTGPVHPLGSGGGSRGGGIVRNGERNGVSLAETTSLPPLIPSEPPQQKNTQEKIQRQQSVPKEREERVVGREEMKQRGKTTVFHSTTSHHCMHIMYSRQRRRGSAVVDAARASEAATQGC
jgi:hypothetical protein